MITTQVGQVPHPDEAGDAQINEFIRSTTGKLGFDDLVKGRVIYIIRILDETRTRVIKCSLESSPYLISSDRPTLEDYRIDVAYPASHICYAGTVKTHSLYGLGVIPRMRSDGTYQWENLFCVLSVMPKFG